MAHETYGDQQDGWLVERKVVSQEAVVKFSDALSYEEAATLPCAGLTAWTAFSGADAHSRGAQCARAGHGRRFDLRAAVGAGGRRARYRHHVERRQGAAPAARWARATSSNYRETAEWGKQVRALSGGRGVDRVVEVGGPGTINQSLRAVAPGGEIASIGFLSDDNPGIDFFALKLSSAILPQHHRRRPRRPAGAGARRGRRGREPVVDRVFPFAQARAAFAYLQTGAHFGKVVIRVA